MAAVAAYDEVLLDATRGHDQRVLDGEDRVLHAVDGEQLAGWRAEDAGLHQAELADLGRVAGDGGGIIVVAGAELVRERLSERERVLHLVLGADPLRVKHVMAAAALRDEGEQPVGVGVRGAERVVAAGADAARHDLVRVEAISGGRRGHPVEYAAHQPIGRRRVVRRRGTVAGARDLEAQRGMAMVDVPLGPRRVVGPVRVEPADEEHDRPPACRLLAPRQAQVGWDGAVAVAG